MRSAADSPSPSLLVLASDTAVLEPLRGVLGDEYIVNATQDTASERVFPLMLAQHDVLLILKDTIDLPYLNALNEALAKTPRPVAIFVGQDPDRLAPVAIRHGITSFIVAGFETHRVPTLIELTIERFKLQQALQNELLKSQEELAARKVIERAKGLLMDKKDLNEQQAYRSLRELAMRQSKPIKEVAETLLLYSEILP